MTEAEIERRWNELYFDNIPRAALCDRVARLEALFSDLVEGVRAAEAASGIRILDQHVLSDIRLMGLRE